MTLPKISLITPSFNQAPYLEECIDQKAAHSMDKYMTEAYSVID
jgi:glycosyltransferase involved in cell wall biosynthesis